MLFNREFAMPNGDTFSIPPIKKFVSRYCDGQSVIVDPFARNSKFATHTNDLNPETTAQLHLHAEVACDVWDFRGVVADVVLFDPPYSPRQISELYKSIGLVVGMKETQNGHMYKVVRDGLDRLLKSGGVCLSFGWSSMGMGLTRGYEIIEILLVPHGGPHNDTICVAERKL